MLICPICQAPLQHAGGAAHCSARHHFDRARQGYLNLLPVQHKNSRAPGDNAAMVEARGRFLDAGHYAPLARRLAQLAASYGAQCWLDIGCGEGYYSAQVAQALPQANGYALDISRTAIRRACKRAAPLNWLVASMARIPLADASCQLLSSVFSPLDWQEARRVLQPGGGLLRMGPAHDHLLQLRHKLYDQVRAYDEQKHLQLIPSGMRLAHSETLSYPLYLETAEARADLLAMTPHGWRASAERRAQVMAAPFEAKVAIRYDWIVRDTTG
jgi:23S rRNA (guanine745-N1)-methyltransferase